MSLNITHLTIPMDTARFSAGRAMVFDKKLSVIGLHAQIPDAPAASVLRAYWQEHRLTESEESVSDFCIVLDAGNDCERNDGKRCDRHYVFGAFLTDV